jgi:hypothetical protein
MKFVILDPKETKLFSNSHVSRIRDIIFLIFSPTHILTTTSKIYVPISVELDFNIPSRLFQGCIVEIGLENIGGGTKVLSSSLISSFRVRFLVSIYPTNIFRDFPANS